MRHVITDLAQRLGQLLKVKGATVTTAESCTGGAIAEAITSVAGSSGWFESGYVTYSNVAKQKELGVSAASLQAFGAVSQEVVVEMAQGVIVKTSASCSVAVSGVAGPDGGSEEKPVGTVWIAWATADGCTKTECCWFEGDRSQIREQAVIRSLQGLCDLSV